MNIDWFTFKREDKLMWLGLLGISAILIVLLSLFTTSSPFYYLQRVVITILMMVLPGYVIMKLFLDHVQFTENPIIDKFMVSFGISIVTVQTLYFLSTYLRTYALNVDEDVISSDIIAVFIVVLVIAAAIGAKFYLHKKNQKQT
jgi:uncharacterized membrane protein